MKTSRLMSDMITVPATLTHSVNRERGNVHSDAELGQVPLVFTGDAETINFMREVAEVEEGKRCDCCGKLITTPLWDMPAGSLCPECAQRLEETVHGKQETPWQKIEQPKQERLIPWWYDL